jgi:hypothetical protein
LITPEEFLRQVRNYQGRNPEQRRGQAMFNVLREDENNAALVEKIRGTLNDPFNDDSRIPFFMIAVFGENWARDKK